LTPRSLVSPITHATADQPHLPSFPTRRSSDLNRRCACRRTSSPTSAPFWRRAAWAPGQRARQRRKKRGAARTVFSRRRVYPLTRQEALHRAALAAPEMDRVAAGPRIRRIADRAEGLGLGK